jgi:hypothetical protein
MRAAWQIALGNFRGHAIVVHRVACAFLRAAGCLLFMGEDDGARYAIAQKGSRLHAPFLSRE